jgi:hypothetical protein
MKKAKYFLFFTAICFSLTGLVATRANAYADLHIQKNMYPRKEPDVVADTLTRMAEPGPIPVMLLIRHTDIFPTELAEAVITADFEGGVPSTSKTVKYNLRLKQLNWHDLQYVETPAGYKGAVGISVKFNMKIRGAEVTPLNNNLRNLKRTPMMVYVGAPAFPRFGGWYFGDIHLHTAYTDNQVEFGAPADISALMAARYGMDWSVFTDHSFDLDDMEEDTLVNDPKIGKWKRMLADVADARKKYPVVVFMPGEELSCGSAENKNVHMIVINTEKFYVGNGDGHETGNAPDLACAGVTAALPKDAAAFAAHPICEVSVVETYLINRGNWSFEDMKAPGLTGLESWNHDQHPNKESFDAWVKLLLAGERKYLSAGTDSHGDFSKEYANGGYEDTQRSPFGAIRTAVYAPDGPLTPEKVTAAMRAGRMVVTSGPFPVVELRNSAGKTAMIGGDISGGKITANVAAKSSPEFGPIIEVKVILGEIGGSAESVIADFKSADFSDPMDIQKTLDLPETAKNGYVRIEAYSQSAGVVYDGYTNPIWFNK